MSLVADLKMGLSSEENVKTILEGQFEDIFVKTPKYHPMDYMGSNCWVEIKTRRNKYDAYPDTMLPYSKIEFAKKSVMPVYFVFVFTDGIYFVLYNEELFSTFSTSFFRRDDRIDVIDYAKEYIFIPIERLERI